MSLSVLHAGDGYAYLTRSVATGDRNRGPMSLVDYYAETGTPPGRWFGKGLDSLAKGHPELRKQLTVSGQVDEKQMFNLFGLGLHPNQEAIHQELLDRAYTPLQVMRATAGATKVAKLGIQFTTYTNDIPVLVAIKAATAEWEKREGSAPTPEVRMAIVSEVAPKFFAEAKGREHANLRELHSWVAHQRRQVRQPVAGFDFTFTPQKSVSVLWALADKETSAKILDLHHRAVDDALTWMESEAAFTRSHSGAAQLDVEGLIVARFDHWDTRSGDPNLHTHCAVSNKVLASDGTWRSLDSRSIHRSAVAASERYNARIVELMEAEMGVEFEAREPAPGKQPVMEVVGVSDELVAAFSTRRSDIEVRRDELVQGYRTKHGRSPSKDTEYKLLQQATLETREGKQEPKTLDEIRDGAMDRAAQIVPAAELEDFAETVRAGTSELGLPDYLTMHLDETVAAEAAAQPGRKPAWIGQEAAANAVVALVSERRADWTPVHVRARAEAISAYFAFATEDERREAIEQTVTAAIAEHSVRLSVDVDTGVPAALRRRDGQSVFARHNEQTYTSVEILEAEESLRVAASEPTVYSAYDASAAAVFAQLREESGRDLNPGQAALVGHFCQSGTALAVGTGPAGAGKTTAMSAVVRIWKAEGRDVIALAPSAAAATVLGDEVATDGRTIASMTYAWRGLLANKGIPARTLPRGMTIAPGTMFLVDEAAMASTKDLAAIAEIAAEYGAVVRLLGDPAQLDAVETGGALRMLAGDTHAPELSDVVRFGADAEQAENSLLLRQGDPEALGMFAQRGWITAGTTTELLDSVFAGFVADTEAGDKSLMLASTNNEIYGLNSRAQLWNQDRGAVADDGTTAALADGQSAFVGDRVVTRSNNRQLRTVGGTRPGAAVLNGDLWTVKAVNTDGSLTVRHIEHEGSVTLPATYVQKFTQLGYASTIHRAQGMTVDISRAVIGKNTDRAGAYVALTRGRKSNHAYVSDSIDLDADIEVHQLDAEPDQLDALTRLTAVLSRDDHTVAASVQIQNALEEATSRKAQLTAYTHGQSLLRDQWISGVIAGVLGTADDDRAQAHPEAYETLRAALGRIHDAGHDPRSALESALSRGEITTAENVAGVLGARLGAESRVQAMEVPPMPPAYAGMDRDLADWARQLRAHLNNPVPVPEREPATAPTLPTGALARLTEAELRGAYDQHRSQWKETRSGRGEAVAERERIITTRPEVTRAQAVLATREAAQQIDAIRGLDYEIAQWRKRLAAETETPKKMFRKHRPNTALAAITAQLQPLEDRRARWAAMMPPEDQWSRIEADARHLNVPDLAAAAAMDKREVAALDAQISRADTAMRKIKGGAAGIRAEVDRREALAPAHRAAEDRARADLPTEPRPADTAAGADSDGTPAQKTARPKGEISGLSTAAQSHPRSIRDLLNRPGASRDAEEPRTVSEPSHDRATGYDLDL